jgi:hypothetical protein
MRALCLLAAVGAAAHWLRTHALIGELHVVQFIGVEACSVRHFIVRWRAFMQVIPVFRSRWRRAVPVLHGRRLPSR